MQSNRTQLQNTGAARLSAARWLESTGLGFDQAHELAGELMAGDKGLTLADLNEIILRVKKLRETDRASSIEDAFGEVLRAMTEQKPSAGAPAIQEAIAAARSRGPWTYRIEPVLTEQRDVPWSGFPGRNRLEQAMAYVKAQPGGANLDYNGVHSRACELVRGAR